jgi:hypothetical protein
MPLLVIVSLVVLVVVAVVAVAGYLIDKSAESNERNL